MVRESEKNINPLSHWILENNSLGLETVRVTRRKTSVRLGHDRIYYGLKYFIHVRGLVFFVLLTHTNQRSGYHLFSRIYHWRHFFCYLLFLTPIKGRLVKKNPSNRCNLIPGSACSFIQFSCFVGTEKYLCHKGKMVSFCLVIRPTVSLHLFDMRASELGVLS